jgi:hypothetical protein
MARSDGEAADAPASAIVSPAKPKISATTRAATSTAHKNGHGSNGHGSIVHSNGNGNGNGHTPRTGHVQPSTIKNHRGQPDLSFEDMS